MSLDSCAVPAGAPALHPALAMRFSPVLFDRSHHISQDEVDVLLAAAGRAPSAGNSQPWAFVVGRRGDSVHARIVRHLAPSSVRWAPGAAVLLVNLAHVTVQDAPELEYSEFSRYDLGQAVAHLSIQGLAMGLDAHQFRAFDRDGVATEFGVPEHWEVTSMIALGRAAHRAGELASPGTSRERLAIADITWARGGEEPRGADTGRTTT